MMQSSSAAQALWALSETASCGWLDQQVHQPCPEKPDAWKCFLPPLKPGRRCASLDSQVDRLQLLASRWATQGQQASQVADPRKPVEEWRRS